MILDPIVPAIRMHDDEQPSLISHPERDGTPLFDRVWVLPSQRESVFKNGHSFGKTDFVDPTVGRRLGRVLLEPHTE